MKPAPYLWFRKTRSHDLSFHLVRHTFKSRSSFFRHGHHDFCELFWIESGCGLHQVNGISQPLEEGTLVLIRQSDVHGFETRSGKTLTIVNCSFPTRTVTHWKRRYFKGEPILFWSRDPLPPTCRLKAVQMQHLQQWTDRLSTARDELFTLDWFLLDVLHLFKPGEAHITPARSMPERLQLALQEMHRPAVLPGGVHELARLAGCSLQHLNRQLRKFGQMPAGDLVTEARLQHAARKLRLTDSKIVDIGLEIGFNNLGHFYQLFKRRYGLTPRQFRIGLQQSVWQ
jgi:AraC family transcriptional regulator, dual regulator of chb operon